MAAPPAQRGGVSAADAIRRLRAAWRQLASDQRLAGLAALALFFTMFFPWYEKRGFFRGQVVRDTLSAWQAFSFVEAAVLLVAAGVLALLFARGERRAFHLPGGDGAVIMGAGAWVALLIVWRLFDKPDVGGRLAGATVGIEWGVFVALAAAAFLAYAGNRVRAAHHPEPPLHQRGQEPAAPDEPIEIHVPEHRPHLARTEVLPRREPDAPPPLSRAAAEQDTAPLREREPGAEPATGEQAAIERGDEDATAALDQPHLPGLDDDPGQSSNSA